MNEPAKFPALVPSAKPPTARDGAAIGDAEQRMLAAALQLTCTRVSDSLRDSMGTDGCAALLSRAIAVVEPQHPSMEAICRKDGGGLHLDGVAAAVDTHGLEPVSAAVDALLAALHDLLGRLIGEDMASRLIDLDSPSGATNEGGEAP
jgi:hypothetical protein